MRFSACPLIISMPVAAAARKPRLPRVHDRYAQHFFAAPSLAFTLFAAARGAARSAEVRAAR